MSQVLSGCAVRAAIQQEQPHPLSDNDRHYLRAIKLRLMRVYNSAEEEPNVREQVSDEIDWLNGQLGTQE